MKKLILFFVILSSCVSPKFAPGDKDPALICDLQDDKIFLLSLSSALKIKIIKQNLFDSIQFVYYRQSLFYKNDDTIYINKNVKYVIISSKFFKIK